MRDYRQCKDCGIGFLNKNNSCPRCFSENTQNEYSEKLEASKNLIIYVARNRKMFIKGGRYVVKKDLEYFQREKIRFVLKDLHTKNHINPERVLK